MKFFAKIAIVAMLAMPLSGCFGLFTKDGCNKLMPESLCNKMY